MIDQGARTGLAEDGIGDLVHRLIDDGKDYARAEVEVMKTVAVGRAAGIKTPLILLVFAIFVAHAAFLALIATLFVALAQVMAPALAGLITFGVLAAVAALAGYAGIRRLKDLKAGMLATVRS